MLAEEETFAGLVRTMKTDGLVMLMLIPLNGVNVR